MLERAVLFCFVILSRPCASFDFRLRALFLLGFEGGGVEASVGCGVEGYGSECGLRCGVVSKYALSGDF